MKHDHEYLQSLRHDQPLTPNYTGVEVIEECMAYAEHMLAKQSQRIAELEKALCEESGEHEQSR